MPANPVLTLPEYALAYNERRFPGIFERHATVALFAVRVLGQQLNDRANKWLAPTGLNFAKYRYLVTLLSAHDCEMILDEIGVHMQTTKASVSEMVAVLEQEKFVERRSNPQDARSSIVRLTTYGRGVMVKAVPLHCRNIELGMKTLSLTERRTLVRLLQKVDFASNEFTESNRGRSRTKNTVRSSQSRKRTR